MSVIFSVIVVVINTSCGQLGDDTYMLALGGASFMISLLVYIAMDDEGWGKDGKERSMAMILDLACINV